MAGERVSREVLLLLLMVELGRLLEELEAMLLRLEAAGRIEVRSEDSDGLNETITQALDELGREWGMPV